MPRLNSAGFPVDIGDGVVLRTPGLEGEAEVLSVTIDGLRSSASPLLVIEEALESQGFSTLHHVEIRDTVEVAPPDVGATRSTRRGEPALELETVASPDGWAQVALSVDEGGVASWCFPERVEGTDATRGGADRNRYLLPLPVAASPPDDRDATRGPVGALGRRIIKVVAARVGQKAAGWLGATAIESWEGARRPYRLRSFLATESRKDGRDLDRAFLTGLRDGPGLLFVHGTFSRAQTAFAALPTEFLEKAHTRYGGRVFAFDHPTLTSDPVDNVEWLRDRLPSETVLDIVCHSRGGLVARGIAGGLSGCPAVAAVDRIVFVATPNAGTALADTEHLTDLIDVFTNLLSLLPPNAVTDVVEPLLEVVKVLAAGVTLDLRGLQSMNPKGAFLRGANAGAGSAVKETFAVAANYEPHRPVAWSHWVKNNLLDGVFRSENDLVVPTESCFSEAGPGFPAVPVERRLLFEADKAVSHGSFFEHEALYQALEQWLLSDRE